MDRGRQLGKIKIWTTQRIRLEMQGSNDSKEKRKSKGGIIASINKELREIEYKEISDNIVEEK